MKKILQISLIIALIFCSGCSVAENPSSNPSSLPIITLNPSNTNPSNEILERNEFANLQKDGYSIQASINQITVDPSRPSSHQINVFITVKNTGNTAVSPFWYCKITDYAGVSNGGFGIGGSVGAGGDLLYPGESHTSADHLFILSDKQFSALQKGATLEVTFFHKESLSSPMSLIGKSSWNVDFNNI